MQHRVRKDYTHGHHKAQERITFDQHDHSATRETLNGGGKADFEISSCARDPLTFIQFVRQELANGRVPPAQQVVYGAIYQVRLEYTGEQTIKIGDQGKDADHVIATIKGPSSNLTVELFFSRDAARAPLLAKLPLALGTFTVELMQ